MTSRVIDEEKDESKLRHYIRHMSDAAFFLSFGIDYINILPRFIVL